MAMLPLRDCLYTHGLTLMSLAPKSHPRAKIRVSLKSDCEDYRLLCNTLQKLVAVLQFQNLLNLCFIL